MTTPANPNKYVKELDIAIAPFEVVSKYNTIQQSKKVNTPFKWDGSFWLSNQRKNTAGLFPSFWDPVTYPLSETDYVSGNGDNDDLKYIGLKRRIIEDEIKWLPQVKTGDYFVFDKWRHLFSDEHAVNIIGYSTNRIEDTKEEVITTTSLRTAVHFLDKEIVLSSVEKIEVGSLLFIDGKVPFTVKVKSIDTTNIEVEITEPIVQQNLYVNYFNVDWLTATDAYSYTPIISSSLYKGLDYVYDPDSDLFFRLIADSGSAIEYVAPPDNTYKKIAYLVHIGDYEHSSVFAFNYDYGNICYVSIDSGALIAKPFGNNYVAEAGDTVTILSCQSVGYLNDPKQGEVIHSHSFEDSEVQDFRKVARFSSYFSDGIETNYNTRSNIDIERNEFLEENVDYSYKTALIANEAYAESDVNWLHTESGDLVIDIAKVPTIYTEDSGNPLYLNYYDGTAFCRQIYIDSDRALVISDEIAGALGSYQCLLIQPYDMILSIDSTIPEMLVVSTLASEPTYITSKTFGVCYPIFSNGEGFYKILFDELTLEYGISDIESSDLEETDASDDWIIGDYLYFTHKNIKSFFVTKDENGTDWTFDDNLTPYEFNEYKLDYPTKYLFANGIFDLEKIVVEDTTDGNNYHVISTISGVLSGYITSDVAKIISLDSTDDLIDNFLRTKDGVPICYSSDPLTDWLGPTQVLRGMYLGTVSSFYEDEDNDYNRGLVVSESLTGPYFMYKDGLPVIRKILTFTIPSDALIESIQFTDKSVFRYRVFAMSDLKRDGAYYIDGYTIYLCPARKDSVYGYISYRKNANYILYNRNMINRVGSIIDLPGTVDHDISAPAVSGSTTLIITQTAFGTNEREDQFLRDADAAAHYGPEYCGDIVYSINGEAEIIHVQSKDNTTYTDFILDEDIFLAVSEPYWIYPEIRPDHDSGYLHLSIESANFEIIPYTSFDGATGTFTLTRKLENSHLSGAHVRIGPSWDTIDEMVIGTSSGGENQEFDTKFAPIVDCLTKDSIKVYSFNRDLGIFEEYTHPESNSFDYSGTTDKHFIVDYYNGIIGFGDGTNGEIPEAGLLILCTYAHSVSYQYEPQFTNNIFTSRECSLNPLDCSERNNFLYLYPQTKEELLLTLSVVEE